jgi:hypothetical protein
MKGLRALSLTIALGGLQACSGSGTLSDSGVGKGLISDAKDKDKEQTSESANRGTSPTDGATSEQGQDASETSGDGDIEGLNEGDIDTSPDGEDERVAPPGNIAGAYLVGCEIAVPESGASAGSSRKAELSCEIQRKDRSRATTDGTWSGEIAEQAVDESLTSTDAKGGEFELTLSAARSLADTLARLTVRFEGTIDGEAQKLSVSRPSTLVTTLLSTPGAGSWLVPDGVTSLAAVEVWGGGGGSSGADAASKGGGGGGGYSRKSDLAVKPGASLSYVVGEGGSSTKDEALPGGNGGDSWFGTETTVLAQGGRGSPAGRVWDGGAGGAAGSGYGDVRFSGGDGGSARGAKGGAGGGASASPSGDGVSGADILGSNDGAAGGTSPGGGAGGAPGAESSNPTAGRPGDSHPNGGGGGGGGGANSDTTVAGGPGGGGGSPGGGAGASGSNPLDAPVAGSGGRGQIVLKYMMMAN